MFGPLLFVLEDYFYTDKCNIDPLAILIKITKYKMFFLE